jgi:hypothetical protein
MAFSPQPRLKTTVSPDNLESLKAELTETATQLSKQGSERNPGEIMEMNISYI